MSHAYPGDFSTVLHAFDEAMRAVRTHPLVMTAFKRNLLQLLSGSTGSITRAQLTDVGEVADAEQLQGFERRGIDALHETVVIKLNGGLGTSMGLEGAKSLIPVRDGLRFLDIIARHVLHARAQYNARIPLLLLNSNHTREESLRALDSIPELRGALPADLMQHLVPKVLAGSMLPAECPDDPALAWCPPGHGDLYLAMQTSGLLDTLLAQGYRYAFVSNADNLGASIDAGILGYFAGEGLEFLMEVADRTAADRKGGHLARLTDGRLTLRERAQCPEEEAEEFQDIHLYRHFNTNSIWLNLPALRALLDRYDGLLPLPLIRNAKTLDPRDLSSPAVYQLETAMGAAISLFDRAAAVRVPRTRFAPVKTTDDLLVVRSDAMVLTEDYRIVPNPARSLPVPTVSLDPRYYRFIHQLDERFPSGAPSLLECTALELRGDVRFGADVTLKGTVRLRSDDGAVLHIPDGSVLEQ